MELAWARARVVLVALAWALTLTLMLFVPRVCVRAHDVCALFPCPRDCPRVRGCDVVPVFVALACIRARDVDWCSRRWLGPVVLVTLVCVRGVGLAVLVVLAWARTCVVMALAWTRRARGVDLCSQS